MTLKLSSVTIGSLNPLSLAAWWAEQFGGRIVEENDGIFVVVDIGMDVILGVMKVDDKPSGVNRIHFDTWATDKEAEAQRLVAAGARLVARRTYEAPDHCLQWIVLEDPEGNQFCLCDPHDCESH